MEITGSGQLLNLAAGRLGLFKYYPYYTRWKLVCVAVYVIPTSAESLAALYIQWCVISEKRRSKKMKHSV